MQMATPKQPEGCTPFKDLTNTVNQSKADPRERKKQRDRNRYAQMSIQQKEELLKKRREARQQKKVTTSNIGVGVEHCQFIDPWEHKRQRDRTRYAQMSVEQKENLLKKRREARQEKKAAASNLTVAHQQLAGTMGDSTTQSGKTFAQRLTDEQIERRRAKDRARYANMTPEQRQAIRDRQNARNRKPDQKQAKRNRDKACRALRRNTLHKDSIAMVNPFYNPTEDSPYALVCRIVNKDPSSMADCFPLYRGDQVEQPSPKIPPHLQRHALGVISGVAVFVLPSVMHNLMYPLAMVIGAANALIMVTTVGLKSALVGEDLNGCAFVYGSLSFLDKISCRIALFVLESYRDTMNCGETRGLNTVSRYGTGLIPSCFAVLSLLVTSTLRLDDAATLRTAALEAPLLV